MVNWNMYTPWPFAELFEELGDKVEVRDYSKYNFVTPIMKPEGMTREQVLKGVLRNYARFYMRKSFLEYPWIRDKFKRRYMLGCLKAFAKTTVTKKFYDLERLKYKGGLSTEVDLGFDESKILSAEQIAQLKRERPDLSADVDFKGTPIKVMACGGSSEQIDEDSPGEGTQGDGSGAGKNAPALKQTAPAPAESN
jgi:anaerobic magnesium-protoporphyrin IX monomethyl ester cyclase